MEGVRVGGEPGPSTGQDLWGSILDSVKGSRAVSAKNVIVLGQAQTGKSTLVDRIRSKTGQSSDSATDKVSSIDLGLSYTVIDVGDEADEETLGRVGLYQVPTAVAPYPELVSLALDKSTLQDSLILITLDWEKPWNFLRQLRDWIELLESVLAKTGVLDQFEGTEARERVEAQWRSYSEPPAPGSTAATAHVTDFESPLAPGTLTNNLGLPIVIVCTKADALNALERDKDFKEDQFDYVQQALRTVALRYGAALLFTFHSRPDSFAHLRSYLLHRLFAQPPPTLASATAMTPNPRNGTVANGAGPAAPTAPAAAPVGGATASRTFGFALRANSVDRDQILIPAGWDSWGKIKVLRDRFDPDALGKGWDLDLAAARAAAAGRPAPDERDAVDDQGRRVVSASRQYDEVVPDLSVEDQPAHVANHTAEAQDEQAFLRAHFEILQKERERDPRQAFAARPVGAGGGGAGEGGVVGLGYGASVVGPMSSGGGEESEVAARMAARHHKKTDSLGRSPLVPSLSPTLPSSSSTSPALSSLPLSPNGSTGAPGASNEILASFFQGLLASRTSGAPGAAGGAKVGGVQGLSPVATQPLSRTGSAQGQAQAPGTSPTTPAP